MIHPAAHIAAEPSDGFTRLDGEDVYRIRDTARMQPFFMNIPSDTDLWMFLTSRGGITAGRVDADGAVFPYENVDRLHDAHRHTGPVTLLRVRRTPGSDEVWEPLSDHSAEDPHVERSLMKSVTGNSLTFEETHRALELAFRYRWSATDEFGLVRTVTLTNLGSGPVSIEILDGLRNVLPHGAPLALYRGSSALIDAYKRTDLDPDARLAMFSLTARIQDRAEPAESLRANTVWSAGLPGFGVSLSDGALDAFRRSEAIDDAAVSTGKRGYYFLHGSQTLDAGESARWHLLVDSSKTQSEVAAIRSRILDDDDLDPAIEDALAQATARLRAMVASADGLQHTAANPAAKHHFANVLFNSLRGGVFADGYAVPKDDFRRFLITRNRTVAGRNDELVRGLPEPLSASDLTAAAESADDPDLVRLVLEYLPLSFGRRHGDPSRPWNRFAIRVRDRDGQRALQYEGNWRDIFQNWEALAFSFPRFLPNLVAKFVNASTVDGFNPYRVTRDGVDWEVENPDDPWSYIGYWGDHQIIYLLKLLESLTRFAPGSIGELLSRPIFCYADVPYRILPYVEIRRDPSSTIRYDAAHAQKVAQRVDRLGTDGKLVPDANGGVLHVTLLEKLLVPALSKLSNLVPGGGIWMNTQRPEWNDANNALVGQGLSVVTMCYLRRYLAYLQTLLERFDRSVDVSTEVANWFGELRRTLDTALDGKSTQVDHRQRWMDQAGQAFSRYRERVYASGFSGRTSIEVGAVADFFADAARMLDREIRAQRRDDKLYHAYNVIELDSGEPVVHRLYEMLEGQVAALSSGVIGANEALELVQELFESRLYREDQNSFLLYPARELPSFLDRNVVPEAGVRSIPLLLDMLRERNDRVVTRDVDGVVRFHADFANAHDLAARLDHLEATDRWGMQAAADRRAILQLYEKVFDHRSFTGRSGTMYGYEGLGCIYWHMVSKLLLAVQEIAVRAELDGKPADVRSALAQAYYRIRGGLGFQKTAREYGAFPLDPYSHTPADGAARQPGMTGQVKEEILTRWVELGVWVGGGTVRFRPFLLKREEFFAEPREFRFCDLRGQVIELPIPVGGLAFTFCQVPIVYTSGSAARIRITRDDGSSVEIAGDTLPIDEAGALFDREGVIRRLDVEIPESRLLP